MEALVADKTDDAKTKKRKYTDDELLAFVREERRRSIGFGDLDQGDLTAAREVALNYAKGQMSDLPSLPNRSKAVDTAVADAVETILPDVMEVFIGGDDVATLIASGEEDEDQAREETQALQQIIFTENEGFLNLYTAFKDAFLTRLGVFHWYPEETEESTQVGQVPAKMADAVTSVAAQQGMELESETQDDGSVVLTRMSKRLRVRVATVPSEDFSVSSDTISLRGATYCAMRDRPRVQDLIKRGVDAEKARDLPSYVQRNDTVDQARDEAGEHERAGGDEHGDLRIVEVRAHYLRIDADDDGDLEILRIVTDGQETVLLEVEEVGQIPFSSITPYMNPHRFYGESVADKMIEIQRIKTVLLRMLLDSGYFALNQRNYVDMSQANEFTVADLLANEPGRPVRGKGPQAVTPLGAGALGFDVFSAMEFVSTMAESRSGIVRNAQGLNPDTLHDTARGAMALITAAQKRVRMIARIIAETGVKDLFLGVHQMMRTTFSSDHQPMRARLSGGWKEIDPSSWPERTAMAIHVGIGSAGREHDLMVASERLQMAKEVMMAPGMAGPLIDGTKLYQMLMAWERAAGSKDADRYWGDPSKAPPQPPPQDPKLVEVQGKQQLAQAQAQADVQLSHAKAAADADLESAKAQHAMALERAKAQSDAQLAQDQLDAEMALKRYQIDAELQLKRDQIANELQMKREEIAAQLEIAAIAQAHGMALDEAAAVHQANLDTVSANGSDVHVGGEPG